jgi:hypothetical protein
MSTELSTNTTPTRGLALATFDDAFRFAKVVAATEFAPKDFRGKPEACMLAIQHGAEIGLAPMQSLQCIAVINGRPSIWGDAAKALCLSSPACEWVTEEFEGDGESLVAVCTAKRKGSPKPTVTRFSVADAKTAKLWGKRGRDGQDTPWITNPKRMLQLRARGFALRDAFPDVLKGLVTAEEAQDYPSTEAAKEPAKPATPSVVKVTAAAPVVPEDPMGKARLAVSRATTFEMLDAIRTLVDRRHAEGVFSEADKQELVALIHHKAEMLIGSEDNGTEFPHEAAEHEVAS